MDMGQNATPLPDDTLFQITVTLEDDRTKLRVTGNDGVDEPWVLQRAFSDIQTGLTNEAYAWLERTLRLAVENLVDSA